MGALSCQVCGGSDVVKQGDYFVCQYCGIKYSLNEVKKIMIEGTVDVSGSTVKIDNSSLVEKYLQNARRAKSKEDWEETEKYYNMVEQNEPTNIEAIFYSAYGKAYNTLILDSDLYKRKAAFGILQKSVSIVDDNFNLEKVESQKEIVKQIVEDINKLYAAKFIYKYKTDSNGNVTWSNSDDTVFLFNCLSSEMETSLENIIKKFPEEQKQETIAYYELAISLAEKKIQSGRLNSEAKKTVWERKIKYHRAIRELDPSHEVPEMPQEKSGGCYVATCVYGSYDCPQVWTLRRFRDYTLGSSWYGRAFIKLYYAVSPTVVRIFGGSSLFRKVWKCYLDKMVANLQENGVSDTPYEDKRW